MLKQEIIWIRTNAELRSHVDKWMTKPKLAVDTEFMRSHTYYPIAALLQLNDGERNYLVDPTTIDDFAPIQQLMQNRSVLKVWHACSEDLEVVYGLLKALPEAMVDTQVVGAWVGEGFSVGYAKMIKSVLGQDIPKDETRSNWLARPLSAAQEMYAAMDVESLYKLSDELLARLEAKGLSHWLVDEEAHIKNNFIASLESEKLMQKFRGAWKLDERQLLLLTDLTKWRDDVAKVRNQPRGRIVSDKALFAIANDFPKSKNDLKKYDGFVESKIKRYGDDVLSLVDASQNAAPETLPERLPAPLTSQDKQITAILRQHIEQLSLRHDLPLEVLIKKKELEDIYRVWSQDNKLEFNFAIQKWRAELLLPTLQQAVDAINQTK